MYRQWNNWQGCCQQRNRYGCGCGWQQNQWGCGWQSRCGCGGSQPWFYGGNFGRPCYGRDFENRFNF